MKCLKKLVEDKMTFEIKIAIPNMRFGFVNDYVVVIQNEDLINYLIVFKLVSSITVIMAKM
jgi:hypothetical protein